MDKRAFLKTAIEVLKYDDKFKKIEKRHHCPTPVLRRSGRRLGIKKTG